MKIESSEIGIMFSSILCLLVGGLGIYKRIDQSYLRIETIGPPCIEYDYALEIGEQYYRDLVKGAVPSVNYRRNNRSRHNIQFCLQHRRTL